MEFIFNRGLHRLIWLYLAEHPGCAYDQAIASLRKDGALVGAEESALLEDMPGNGVACSYALDCLYDVIKTSSHVALCDLNFCAWCPFTGLRVKSCGCKDFTCMNGVYAAWSDTQKFLSDAQSSESPSGKLLHEKLARIYATQIANWPVKDGVICIGE